MRHSRLLSLLLRRVMAPAEMGGGGGGAAVVDEDEDLDGDTAGADDVDGNADDEGGEGSASAADEGEEDDSEVVISLGGEPEPAEDDDDASAEAAIAALGDETANDAFARMRVARKELKRRLQREEQEKLEAKQRARELEEQLQAMRPAEATIEVGKEPDPDEYEMYTDEGKAKFKADYAAFNQRKAEAAVQKEKREQAQREQQKQWADRLTAVDEATAKLPVKAQKEAVQAFDSTFSVVQRGIVMGALDTPETSAQMRHALGTNSMVARKLAAINDPVKFAVAIGELKANMKITKTKRVAPAPDRRVQSGKPGAAAVGNQLERLRAEADRTGDRSKVARYLRDHPQAA